MTRYLDSRSLLRHAVALELNARLQAASAVLEPICKTHPPETRATSKRF